MKNCLFVIALATLMGCGSGKEGGNVIELKAWSDSVKSLRQTNEFLQAEIDSLKKELSSFKDQRKKHIETNSGYESESEVSVAPKKKKSAKSEAPATETKTATSTKTAKTAKAPVKESERNSSVRCSGKMPDGTRCKRRTFSPNGMCWQHGGN